MSLDYFLDFIILTPFSGRIWEALFNDIPGSVIFVDILAWRHLTLSLCKRGDRVTKSSFCPSKKKIRKKIFSHSNLKIAGFYTVMSYEVLQHILRLKDSPSIIDVVYSTRAVYFYLRFHAKNNHLDSNITKEFE